MSSSMTGFGKAKTTYENYEIVAELRSLNNRYLDIIVRLPKSLENYEQLVKEEIKKKIIRGKISANISFNGKINGLEDFKLNEEALSYYHKLLHEIQSRTGVKGDITIDHLLQFSDLLKQDEEEIDDEKIKNNLLATLRLALDKLVNMRQVEAKNITEDIKSRIQKIDVLAGDISEKGNDNPKQDYDKLYQRVQSLLKGRALDEYRLEMEIALLSDKVDITEECTRLKSHLKQFNTIFTTKAEVGKPLTFILQEMHREVNTIGSKTTIVEISHAVITMKEEIEKLREQVQNLE